MKDKVFEIIRKEDAIIWAGAGLSMYAGYSSGFFLRDSIYSALSKDDKEDINENTDLMTLSEEFVRSNNGSKNQLIGILKNEFEKKKPKSIEFHKKLSQIPHIRNIITTNFDKLFELAYEDNLNLCFKDEQLPYLNSKYVNLFKIHGDLSDPNSIILTKTDYENSIVNQSNSAMWSHIHSLLSTKTVVFIGYNLEDSNVSIVFDSIIKQLGDHRKESFFVSPRIPKRKVNFLIKKGIHFIESTGEKFIDELLDNIKQNIIKDFERQNVLPSTFNKFLSHRNLSPSIIGEKDSFKLQSIRSISGNLSGEFSFSNFSKEFIKKINDFINGNTQEDSFIINEEGSISVKLEDIKIFDNEDYGELQLVRAPNQVFKIDIEFKDDFEIKDLVIELYKTGNNVSIKLRYPYAKIDLQTTHIEDSRIDFRVNYLPLEKYKRISDAMEAFEFIYRLSSGMRFDITSLDYPEVRISKKLTHNKSAEALVKLYLEYFKNLRKVKRSLNINLEDILISDINEESINNIRYLKYYFDGKLEDLLNLNAGILATIDDNSSRDETLRMINASNKSPVIIKNGEDDIFNIHGIKVNIGKRVLIIHSPKASKISNEKDRYRIVSRSKKIEIEYEKK